jgi:hypothetical protein
LQQIVTCDPNAARLARHDSETFSYPIEGRSMPSLLRACTFLLVSVSLLLAVAPAQAQQIFGNSFEKPFNFPADDADAARFLNQATFGATPTSIALVRQGGLSNWFQQQGSLPPTLARPFL